MNSPSVSQLNIAGVSHRCANEQRNFLNGKPFDPAYCYELFHRALNRSDDGAWQNLLEIFSPLVSGWVLRHPDFSRTDEDVEYFVQGAFVRFWTALSGRGLDEGRDLAALLLYLKRCVHSEIVDHLRRERLRALAADTEEMQEVPDSIQVQTDPIAVENLWAFVEDKLIDEKERIVIYASFFLAFQPREIFAHYQSHFSGVREVYRIKENVIARLKRAPQLEDFVSIDG